MNKAILLRLYLFLSALVLLNILLHLFGMPLSLWGHYSDRVLRWIWAGLTVAVIVLFWRRKAARAYLVFLLAAGVLSMLPMGIPLAMALEALTDEGLVQRVPVSGEYRIERRKPLFDDVQVQLFRRTGIFEQELGARYYDEVLTRASGKVHYLPTSVNPDFPSDWTTRISTARVLGSKADSVLVEYTVLGKTVLLAHSARYGE